MLRQVGNVICCLVFLSLNMEVRSSASMDEKVGKELNTTPDINERCSSQNHLQDDGAVYALRTSLALGTS